MGFLVLSLTSALALSKVALSAPTCSDIVLPVTISAENHDAPDYLLSALSSGTGLESLLNGIGNEVQSAFVHGTYNIAARFCEPEVHLEDRHNHIQLLVHGITYDRNYWSGGNLTGYDGDRYSWISYASKQGYPTLSIDRLGNGKSDHPDPILVVQKPAQVEVIHEVVKAIRAGLVGGRAFSKIAYVGHSYGSLIGNTVVARYPGDVDALLLTGWSSAIKPAILGVITTPLALPAATVDLRFGNLSVGYLALSLESQAHELFFTDDQSRWDPTYAHWDWLHRGTATLGEGLSALFTNDVAENYTKPVLILTGHKDQIFCGLAMPLLGEADCSGVLERSKSLFPNTNVSITDIANTGHCLNLHYNANETFSAAHQFLSGIEF